MGSFFIQVFFSKYSLGGHFWDHVWGEKGYTIATQSCKQQFNFPNRPVTVSQAKKENLYLLLPDDGEVEERRGRELEALEQDVALHGAGGRVVHDGSGSRVVVVVVEGDGDGVDKVDHAAPVDPHVVGGGGGGGLGRGGARRGRGERRYDDLYGEGLWYCFDSLGASVVL